MVFKEHPKTKVANLLRDWPPINVKFVSSDRLASRDGFEQRVVRVFTWTRRLRWCWKRVRLGSFRSNLFRRHWDWRSRCVLDRCVLNGNGGVFDGVVSTAAVSAVSVAAGRFLLGRPRVLALRALVVFGLQNADATSFRTVVADRIAVSLLPRKNDSRDADHLGFDFEASLRFIDNIDGKVTGVVTRGAFGAATSLIGQFVAKSSGSLVSHKGDRSDPEQSRSKRHSEFLIEHNWVPS